MLGVFTLMGFLSFGSWSAIAQTGSMESMEIVREKLRADKKFFISQNMELTEAEGKAFWPVYEQYQPKLMKLGEQKLHLIKKFSDNYESMSDEKAKELLNEYLAIDTTRHKVRLQFLPKFRKVLSEKKVARYYQLEQKAFAAANYDLAANIPLLK
jgi:hypothetical protein